MVIAKESFYQDYTIAENGHPGSVAEDRAIINDLARFLPADEIRRNSSDDLKVVDERYDRFYDWMKACEDSHAIDIVPTYEDGANPEEIGLLLGIDSELAVSNSSIDCSINNVGKNFSKAASWYSTIRDILRSKIGQDAIAYRENHDYEVPESVQAIGTGLISEAYAAAVLGLLNGKMAISVNSDLYEHLSAKYQNFPANLRDRYIQAEVIDSVLEEIMHLDGLETVPELPTKQALLEIYEAAEKNAKGDSKLDYKILRLLKEKDIATIDRYPEGIEIGRAYSMMLEYIEEALENDMSESEAKEYASSKVEEYIAAKVKGDDSSDSEANKAPDSKGNEEPSEDGEGAEGSDGE